MMELTICGFATGDRLDDFQGCFDGVDVGCIQSQGHVRNHFLDDLDDPGHQFVAIFFGRSQVDVDIVHAFFFLKKGFFLDRLGDCVP
jgi:hypothetical protein